MIKTLTLGREPRFEFWLLNLEFVSDLMLRIWSLSTVSFMTVYA